MNLVSKKSRKKTPSPDTEERILRAAYDLFLKRGFRDVPVRDIAAKARANVALVFYYFGTKDELILRVYDQSTAQQRLQRLQGLLKAAELRPRIDLADLIAIYIKPLLVSSDSKEHEFVKFHTDLARERPDLLSEASKRSFNEFNAEFIRILAAFIPGVPRKALIWRLYAMIGALMFLDGGNPPGMVALSEGRCDPMNRNEALRELLPFLTAGISALPPGRPKRAAKARAKAK